MVSEEEKVNGTEESLEETSMEEPTDVQKETLLDSTSVNTSSNIQPSSTTVQTIQAVQPTSFTINNSYFTTQEEKVNVYASQSTSSQILGVLKPNVEYELKRIVDSSWIEVSFAGLTGYILQQDARPSDGANVERKNPGLKVLWEERSDTAVKIVNNPDNPTVELGYINPNISYKIVGTAGINYLVIDVGNRLGYVAREQFTSATSYLLPAYETTVQGYQDGKFKVLGTIAGNTEYKLHRLIGKDWVTFNYGGVEGYIKQKDARPGDGTKMERKNPGLGTLWVERTSNILSIVDNPDNPTKVLGKINANIDYKVVGTAGINYYAIDLGKRLGYVARDQFTSATSYLLPAYETTVQGYQDGKFQVLGTIAGNTEYKLHRLIGKDWVTFNYGGVEGYIKQKDARPGDGTKMERKNPGLGTLWVERTSNILSIVDNPDNPDNPTKVLGKINANIDYKVVGTAGINYYVIDLGKRLGYVAREQFTSATSYLLPAYETTVQGYQDGKFQVLGTIAGNIEYKLHRLIEKDWVTFNYGGVEGYIKQKDARPGDGTKMERKNPGLGTLWVERTSNILSIVDNPDNPTKVLGKINANIDYKVVGTAGINYYAIDLGKRLGYVARDQFTSTTKYFLPAYTVTVYENQNGTMTAVGEISGNVEYQLKRIEQKDWVVFNIGGKEGYVKQKDARPGTGNLFENKNPNLPVLYTALTNRSTNVFLLPSTTSGIAGTINSNQEIKVVGTAGSQLIAIDVGGRLGYVPVSNLLMNRIVINNTYYTLTFDELLNLQMKTIPQDTINNYNAYIYKDALVYKDNQWIVSGSAWNVRSGPGTNYHILGTLPQNTKVTLLNDKLVDQWYQIDFSKHQYWVNASSDRTSYYLNPDNFKSDATLKYQFLNLSESANINPNEVNSKFLSGAGILEAKASVFVEASKNAKINEIYLISHALLETGKGTSELANGIPVKIVDQKVIIVDATKEKPDTYVYNMYGIGARDSCAKECGAQTAYDLGWTTPEKAIIGGAEWIASKYINNSTYKQNTLYKMRWNPDNPGTHQYATDIGWAAKQTYRIASMYKDLEFKTEIFDIPIIKK